jgi:hypothetical protein
VIAYNLENLWRRLALPKKIGNWSLTSLQQRWVKAGGHLIKHARYYRVLLASRLPRRLFGSMLPQDRGAAAVKRVAKLERQRIERSEAI